MAPVKCSGSLACGVYVLLVSAISSSHGGCHFPKSWSGGWFQSVVPHSLHINSTHLGPMGECYEEQGDKYIVYDRSENCYKCMTIHERHANFLQYAESRCESDRTPLRELCRGFADGVPPFSMFRRYPEARPVACPFRDAPFTFGQDNDCGNPPGKVESCVDDTKLVLNYRVCPNLTSSESRVEELVCLATWKEGSTRYLIARISQENRRSSSFDEQEQYHCFVYHRDVEDGKVVYNITQCEAQGNSLRTMKFTAVDIHRNRCKFPSWITDHHTWLSPAETRTFRFSQRNATLIIMDAHPEEAPTRFVCHEILQQSQETMVRIVAHATRRCASGYVCILFSRRDGDVIEMQQSEEYEANPGDVCENFDNTTLTTTATSLHRKEYAHHAIVATDGPTEEKRQKRQQSGGCQFPKMWSGEWFQSGVLHSLHINSTYIETKGECYEEQGDKYLVYDKSDNCYRCMAIHVKHTSVLQYKETFCESKASLQDICYGITGDAALYSMFRKYPEAKPVACPFKSAPFTFSYNRGAGDCGNPPSKAESCTDDSRLVLKYQACPDVTATESNVEELVCLAVWKEGSTRYLIGRISQGNRRSLTSDEDQYRCFIYQRDVEGNRVVYNIAQSGDATCTGVQNAFEGSRTMKFTTVDNHHNRCKFPNWITDHHTWLSLDHKKTFKFSQRNATLKIVDEDPKPNKVHQNYAQHFAFQEFGMESQEQRKQNSEMRVICHSILQSQEQKKVQIVAHMTHGCDSGYVCMVFYKRDSNVIEIQQSERYEENPDDACRYFDTTAMPYTTLITTTLHPKKCPHLGRYTVTNNSPSGERRKKRQQPGLDNVQTPGAPECLSYEYEALAVGCSGSHELMEFRTPCVQQPISGYTCHGSWHENNTFYVITSPVARKSTDALRYCFMYTLSGHGQASVAEGTAGKSPGPPILRLSGVSGSCNRDIVPGLRGSWAFNFTSNGTCAETTSTSASNLLLASVPVFLLTVLLSVVVLR